VELIPDTYCNAMSKYLDYFFFCKDLNWTDKTQVRADSEIVVDMLTNLQVSREHESEILSLMTEGTEM